ncbi:glycosyltransferase [Psychrobacter okhotskensis]|uniref:glycosyltransferase n=1 Tax=Psychrobacter okhotskensis TaxID=212403 RepID=UPI00191981BE|nr:glycosyltransferase [Psychrobacter okhotskensis]
MKKIYITSRHLQHGGIEKVVCNLSNLFIKMNYDVIILCFYDFGKPVYDLDEKIKIVYLMKRLPRKNYSLIKLFKEKKLKKIANEIYGRCYSRYLNNRSIIKYIKDVSNSIIITTRNEHTKVINKTSEDSNKLIAQLHCDYTQYEGYIDDIKNEYGNIDYLLLLNQESRSEVESILFGHNKKVKCLTVPNFIIHKEYNANIKREKQIVSVGRLSSEKGFDKLLHIWERFIVNHKDYILKIVGDGEEKESLMQLAWFLGVGDSVVFTGFLSNDKVVEEMRKSKLCVMTSLHEAFPLVLLESISQGTPVIAYDIRVGPRSIIKDGYNGFLIEDNNIETFIAKLNFLLEEYDVYNSFSKNAIDSSMLYTEERLRDIWFSILN